MAKLDQLLQNVRAELGGDFIASDIVGMDGISIASSSSNTQFDSTAAAARMAMVMKLCTKVSDKLTLGDVQENMSTTDKTIIMSRLLGNGTYFWMMAVPKDASLGAIRMVMTEYQEQMWDAIPH